MARCQRCNACMSQWDFGPCMFCGFPGKDKRSLWEKIKDFIDRKLGRWDL